MLEQSNQLSKGKVAVGVLILAVIVSSAIAVPTTIGIAIFDRSRGITDPVVITAGVLFALSILGGIGSCLKQACVQNINAQNRGFAY